MALEIPRIAMVVIISNDHIVIGGPGCHRISLQIPSFPIHQKECFLSLFINEPRKLGEIATQEIYDQISWTTGNSIRLINEDASTGVAGVISRHLVWRRSNDRI
jgi:hypothetical protein